MELTKGAIEVRVGHGRGRFESPANLVTLGNREKRPPAAKPGWSRLRDLPWGIISPVGMTLPTDRELIAAAAKGEVAAFATLVGRYRDVRTRYAMRMLGDHDAADEALQAAFVRAFQSVTRYREPEPFESWLFRIVVNECRTRALRTAVRARRATGEVDAIADWRA